MAGRSGLVVGVDLGGTKIEAVLALRGAKGELEVLERRRVPTGSEDGYEGVLKRAEGVIRGLAPGEEIATIPIGMGMPGGTTRRGGLVKNCNLVCLNGRPFRADLARALGREMAFENDANCFALAETVLGAAAAFREGIVFGVILGTGVGGGVVVRGEIWSGGQGIAGEWGHHAMRGDAAEICYCGNTGCLELYASGPAVERAYLKRSGRGLGVAEIARVRGEDADAEAAIQGLVEAFARGLANVIDIVDPSAVVLGGGVSNLDVLYEQGARRVGELVFNDELTTPILRNSLGDSAGVLGAALIAR
ncbi:MAG: ROK family protein [Byssovorax sp.]